uniref:Sulfotransferase domain-containing protein n=1 Tax=viral metagenome TaxID=1070528 RepID=A0A6C0B1I5_9ZZZZ
MFDSLNLLGPFNSGTNLVVKLLENQITCKFNGSTHYWKHGVNFVDVEEKIQEKKNTLFIVCYRPLYSWIKSVEKEQYNLIWDKQINSPVSLNGFKFNNIIEMHESYYNIYKHFIDKYPNVIKVEYYKICDNTISYDYMARKLKPFNILLPNKVFYDNILNMPSKNYGVSVNNSQEALKQKAQLDVICPEEFKKQNEITNYFEE